MIEHAIGKRYGEALANSLAEPERMKSALEDLRSFCEAFKVEAHLTRFFAHPAISQENKAALIKELCDRFKVNETVANLVLMLVKRNKILYLKQITGYFEKLVDQRLNQVRVEVRAAYPLSEDNIERLKTSLNRILQKEVLIETQVDESLLGGVVLHVGDLVADASITNRLAALKRTLEKEEVA